MPLCVVLFRRRLRNGAKPQHSQQNDVDDGNHFLVGHRFFYSPPINFENNIT